MLGKEFVVYSVNYILEGRRIQGVSITTVFSLVFFFFWGGGRRIQRINNQSQQSCFWSFWSFKIPEGKGHRR